MLVVAVFSFVVPDSGHAYQKRATAIKSKLIKPDLTVSSLKIAKIAKTPSGDHRVRISVVVLNRVPGSCAENFKAQVSWSQKPFRRYKPLANGGIVKLCAPAGRRVSKAGMKRLFFEDTVKEGTHKKYRVIVDPRPGRVLESNESNNMKFADYRVPKSILVPQATATSTLSTIGIDLVFKSVQVWKQNGFIYILPTLKNQRSGNCSGGSLLFKIVGKVQQPFTSSFNGNSEFTLTGLGFQDDGSRSCRIRIELSGACTEVIRTNNEQTVSLLNLSETRKTIRF